MPLSNLIRRSAWALAGLSLLITLVVFRLPVLFNYAAVNSDVAIAGLEAWHLRNGEAAWVLWGTDYQGVTGPVIALFVELLVGGPPGWALRLSSMLGFAILVLALFGTLRRPLGTGLAAATSLMLVVCPEPVNYLSYDPCRIWSLTFAYLAIYCTERSLATRAARSASLLGLAAGASLGLAVYSDLFVIQMLPGFGLYALIWGWSSRRRVAPILSATFGLALCIIPFFGAHLRLPAESAFQLSNLTRNWRLFWDQCVPYLMGSKAFAWRDALKEPVAPPGVVWHSIVLLGTACFVALATIGMFWSLRRAASETSRRLAWLGTGWILMSLIGFLFTDRPVDVYSARYLGPVLFGFPFASAPVIERLRQAPQWALALLAPIIASFAVAGWHSYGGWVNGLWPVSTRYGTGADEKLFLDELQRRQVEFGVGDYWVAYRLTYLFREKLIVIPTYSKRYPPYEQQVAGKRNGAYIFYLPAPQSQPGSVEQWLRSRKVPYERIAVGPYLAILPSAWPR